MILHCLQKRPSMPFAGVLQTMHTAPILAQFTQRRGLQFCLGVNASHLWYLRFLLSINISRISCVRENITAK